MRINRFLVPVAVFAVLVMLLGIGLRFDPRLVPSPLIGRPAPQFELPQLQVPESRISNADLRGKVTLVNVWASWCLACRHEHGLLLELAREGKVPIYGLNYKDKRDAALAWLQEFGDPYVASAFDENGRVGIEFGVYGVPETFIVDDQGIIRYKHIGPLDSKSLEEDILPLLAELGAPVKPGEG